MKYTYNNPKLKDLRRKLRIHQTDAESLLWYRLRNRRLDGYRFVRQYSVGRYIIDFYCPDFRLGIELDGGQHDEEEIVKYDIERSGFLASQNIRILRFWNTEVKSNIDGILSTIHSHLD